VIISKMQRKLATWAVTDPSRRISQLLRLITLSEGLAEAAWLTFSSKRAHSPSVDGMNTESYRPDCLLSCKGSAKNLSLVTTSLCQPDGVISRKVTANCDHWVSQRCGIVQRAMLMVMEPIWESDVHTLSYGFRPERRAP